jgi:hypothetical protein
MSPANLTCGIWREVAYIPSKSQIAFALEVQVCQSRTVLNGIVKNSRRWINLIQEAAAISAVEDSCEAPRLVLEGLHIHDLNKKYISRSCTLDLKRATQVVNSSQINVTDVVCRVIITDLTTSPARD